MLFVLPFPPTTNTVYRSRIVEPKDRDPFVSVYMSTEGREYKARCQRIIERAGVEPFKGPVSVRAWMVFDSNRGDLTNRRKLLLDLLEDFAYENDRQVWEYHETRHLSRLQRPRVILRVVRYQLQPVPDLAGLTIPRPHGDRETLTLTPA